MTTEPGGPGRGDDERIRHIEELVLGPAVYTGQELADATGMAFEEAERLWVELGFPPIAPDVRCFTASDAEVLRNVAEFRGWEVVGFEDIVGMTRVLGQAMARAAGAQARLTLTGAEALEADRAPAPDGDGTEALDAAVTLGLEVSERFIDYVWRRHLAAALRRALDPRPTEVVGFADIVGYTRLSSSLERGELEALLGRFQHAATVEVTRRGGQVVKLIGDAVMFVAPDAPAAARAALGIREQLGEDGSAPPVRVGLAMGPLVHLEGDVYGDTVNRSSRIAELARPDTVLADDAVAAAVEDSADIVARAIRPHRLKGIGMTRCWVLRRAAAERR
jgi:adenylate cyclase